MKPIGPTLATFTWSQYCVPTEYGLAQFSNQSTSIRQGVVEHPVWFRSNATFVIRVRSVGAPEHTPVVPQSLIHISIRPSGVVPDELSFAWTSKKYHLPLDS